MHYACAEHVAVSDARQLRLHEALALHRGGHLVEATAAYRRLLSEDPSSADVLNLLGVALAQAGPCEEAVTLIRRATEICPGSAQAQRNLGNALSALGQHAEALAGYRQALTLAPGDVLSHLGCGRMLLALGRPDEAIGSYDAAIAIDSRNAAVHAERAGVLLALHRYDAALAGCDGALRIDSGCVAAYVNRALTLAALARYADAEATLARAQSLAPDDADVLYHRGNCLVRLAQHREGLACLERALALRPDNLAVRWNIALLTLLTGKLREGWPLYEARFARDELRGCPQRDLQPRWNGDDDLRGRTILLWAERGLGDTLQFSRYVPLVQARGADVIFQVQARLKKFYACQFAGVRVIDDTEAPGAHDLQSPLLSLPGAFRTEMHSIPAAKRYLKADPGRIGQWAEPLQRFRGLRVGIAWQGNPDAERNWASGRSVPVREFAVLARESGVDLVSLQAPPWHQQLESAAFKQRILSFGARLDAGEHGFLDTAALMSHLDLVICCDTAVAHLAGALGIPVWVALHTTSEWRWLLERSDSPWYPTMRLFRQRRPGDWTTVFADMAAELRSVAAKHGQRNLARG